MDARTLPLEVIHRAPAKRWRKPTLLFVHGAYTGAWCWDVHFLPYLARCGFPSYAVSLRGHGSSRYDGNYADLGIDDYVDDLERTIASLDESPVLIGHSMGGLVVTRFLARAAAKSVPGAVLMAPVPTTGLTPALMALAFRAPWLLAELNQVQFGHTLRNELPHIRRALFSEAMEEHVVRSYLRRMQGEAQRALFEMAMLHLRFTGRSPTLPLLVLGAENDGLFAPELINVAARGLGAPCEIFPAMAHAMMLEPGWRTVADRIGAWAEALEQPTTRGRRG